MCILIAESAAPAALREITGAHAFLETNARPEIGRMVELRHPEAGSIQGRVIEVKDDGIGISLDRGENAVAFALAAIAADMSRP